MGRPRGSRATAKAVGSVAVGQGRPRARRSPALLGGAALVTVLAVVPSSGAQSVQSGRSVADASNPGSPHSSRTTSPPPIPARTTPQPSIPSTVTSTSVAPASTSTSLPASTAPSTGAQGSAGPPAAPGTSTPNSTTTAPAPASPSCGNQTTLVADGATWACSFDSEFTGTSLDTKQWMPMTTASSGYISGLAACYVDSPNNISVGNGYLSLTARKEAAPFLCKEPFGSFFTQYTSGTVSTYGLFSQAYGRFEVKAKLPAATVAGLQSSLWLFPQNELKYGGWPNSGEIDIAETYSEYPTLAIPTVHYSYDPGTANPSTNTNIVTNDACTINPNLFNDYVAEWTPSTITMIYNGKTCLVDHWIPQFPESGSEPFDQPFFINLTQALGIDSNYFNPATTPLPATSEIQYVRVWKLQP
jgi:beta-glucanase (GH16 family)